MRRDRLAHWSQEREDQALADHGELYLNHLMIAKHTEGWADRVDEWQEGQEGDEDEPFVKALREVAAHLRQGDYLPDGLPVGH